MSRSGMPVASPNNGTGCLGTGPRRISVAGRGRWEGGYHDNQKPQGRRQQRGSNERDEKRERELFDTREKKGGEDLRAERGPGRAGDQQQTDRVMTAAEPRASGRSPQTYTARARSPSRVPAPGECPTKGGPPFPARSPFLRKSRFPGRSASRLVHGWRAASHLFPRPPDRFSLLSLDGGTPGPHLGPRRIESGGEMPQSLEVCRSSSHVSRALSSMQRPRQSYREGENKGVQEPRAGCARADDGKRRIG